VEILSSAELFAEDVSEISWEDMVDDAQASPSESACAVSTLSDSGLPCDTPHTSTDL
jgi:hypothetical protein